MLYFHYPSTNRLIEASSTASPALSSFFEALVLRPSHFAGRMVVHWSGYLTASPSLLTPKLQSVPPPSSWLTCVHLTFVASPKAVAEGKAAGYQVSRMWVVNWMMERGESERGKQVLQRARMDGMVL